MATREKTAQVRQHIIKTTDNLLYHKGFNLMSFSDIAQASQVPRGNIYYYFKTKDDVLAAVIEYRLQHMQSMLNEWDSTLATPLERLKRYAKIPLNELENVVCYGCPMGSLNTELGKSQPLLQQISRQQFDFFKAWLIQQFQQLAPDKDAEKRAMHLLVLTQGLAVMAQVYADSQLVQREVTAINTWLDEVVAS
jgi:AcrR family transcriptional regulator